MEPNVVQLPLPDEPVVALDGTEPWLTTEPELGELSPET
ncbi:hypothetical protein HNR05_001407 [Leifsonia psychrotolerans]|uniref:Uncharacterized protein n=1 Tax=Glaciibacter psychrotolerans TaxID=670054 RepID=A0A7Z0EDF1_9MICO|nr:hypothetical protein [Leifsonia psychrotolerans]